MVISDELLITVYCLLKDAHCTSALLDSPDLTLFVLLMHGTILGW